MVCNSCNSKWETQNDVKKCPFCGADLQTYTENITFEDVSSCLGYVFSTYGEEIVQNKARLISVISDFMPSLKSEKRLISVAAEAGVFSSFIGIAEDEIENARIRAVLTLTDSYFISQEHAENVVKWIVSALTGKTVPETKNIPVQQKAPAPKSAGKKESCSNKQFPGGYYTGDLVDGLREGKGSFSYSVNSNKYNGYWQNDKCNGFGSLSDRYSIPIYEGEWTDNKRHGKGTEYWVIYATGRNPKILYKGEWKNDVYSGRGSLCSVDGLIIYEGQWKNGIRSGEGTQYNEDGSVAYSGIWEDDEPAFVPDGFKYVKVYDGGIYKGDMQNGMRHGEGTYFYKDGRKYVGQWKDDKEHGSGVLYSYNRNKIYDGQWQNGMRHGTCEIYIYGDEFYKGGMKDDKRSGYGDCKYKTTLEGKRTEKVIRAYNVNSYFVEYQGQWEDDVYSGNGCLYNKNGKLIYDGEFKNGVAHGKGKVYSYYNKLFYEGEFVNGYIEGNGTEYKPDGSIKYQGGFKQNRYDGDGVLYYPNGKKEYEGQWKSGVREGKGSAYNKLGIKTYSGQWKNDFKYR